MKILYHIPYPDAVDAGRFIFEGWRDAFISMGHTVDLLTAADNTEEKIHATKPNLFITATNLHTPEEKKHYYTLLKKNGAKIAVWVDWPMREGDIELIKNESLIDIHFGEREPETMTEFEKITGKHYVLIPNAANKTKHYPVAPVKKYQHDVVFLGAKLPLKQKLFDEILFPLRKRYSIKVYGPGWTKKDLFLRACARIAKKMHLYSLVSFFNKLRITVPINEENALYSSAKICLNFHEQDAKGNYEPLILNQRGFKIPACGGFELCDNPVTLRRYFSADEVIMANTPEEWSKLIEYYLIHEDERKRIQEKGTKRALEEHTYHNRVALLLGIYQSL